MKLLFLAIAFVAGATSSVQVIVNAQLRTYLVHPIQTHHGARATSTDEGHGLRRIRQ